MSWIARALSLRIFRFACIGVVGFIVDESVLTLLLWSGHGKYLSRVISISAAMTATWLGNRYLTFREQRAAGASAMAREALRFFAANSIGAVISYTVYAALINLAPDPLNQPNLAVVLSVTVAMFWNFTLSKYFVFGRTQARTAGKE